MEAATTPLSAVGDRARRLIAASSTFQTLVGSPGDAAAALLRVLKPEAIDGTDDWPRAIVEDERPGITLRGVGNVSRSGQIKITLELEVPATDDDDTRTMEMWVLNRVGAILEEMAAQAGKGTSVDDETHLCVTELAIDDGPWQYPEEENDPSDQKPRWWTSVLLSWQG